MADRCVFEEVFDEEEVARDPLDRFYQKVVQRQFSRAGFGALHTHTHRHSSYVVSMFFRDFREILYKEKG